MRAVNRFGRSIGAAADWAVRMRPRWPAIETGPEHPPWVARALNDCLPLLAMLSVAAVLRLLNMDWAWLAFAIVYGAYLLFFDALPWLVNIARNFAAGYGGR